MNRAKILNMLRLRGTLTKYELSSTLQLSHTTINTYIQELINEGLVEVAGVGESIGGRKPIIIQMVKEARHFFGVYFSPHKIIILLVNLLGEEIERKEFDFTENFEYILEKVKNTILSIIKKRKLVKENILGVGMVFPGIVDGIRNQVEYAPNIGLGRYCFDDFERTLGIKIYLENEAIAAIKAEQFIGGVGVRSNVVYISIAEGIGTGIVIDNTIYKSNNKKAGEFGHIRIVEEGLQCKCGRKGCWELYASKIALLRYYKEINASNVYTLDHLTEGIKNKEKSAFLAVEKYVRFLFKGIENILLAISPDEVVIGGDLGFIMEEILKVGLEKLKLNKYFYGYEDIPIRVSVFKENGAIIGSALIPLLQIYNY